MFKNIICPGCNTEIAPSISNTIHYPENHEVISVEYRCPICSTLVVIPYIGKMRRLRYKATIYHDIK